MVDERSDLLGSGHMGAMATADRGCHDAETIPRGLLHPRRSHRPVGIGDDDRGRSRRVERDRLVIDQRGTQAPQARQRPLGRRLVAVVKQKLAGVGDVAGGSLPIQSGLNIASA